MSKEEIVFAVMTAIVASYGAVLATILGLREFRREKRNIVLFLEFVAFYEKYRLVIVNSGFRPITLTSVAIDIYDPKQKEIVDQAPANTIISAEEETDVFPVTLKDGEQVAFWLTEVLRDYYPPSNNKLIPVVSVFDAEGHVWKTDKVRLFNPKFGKYEK